MCSTPRRSITLVKMLKPGCTVALFIGEAMVTVGGAGSTPLPCTASSLACEFWVVPPQMQATAEKVPQLICLLRKNFWPQPSR